MKRFFLAVFIVFVGWAIRDALGQTRSANGQTKQIQSSKDTTLIEDPKGMLANSEGPTIFVGRTGQPEGSIRRGLIAFDFAGAIPPHSKIISVTLTMSVSLAANGDQPETISLYRVTRPWKEGPSLAEGGRGAEAKAGDPTWLHSSYPTTRWARAGGDYIKAVSANTEVRGTGAAYTWNSTPKLVADVQFWVNAPNTNFGWIIIGDESKAPTAKVFQSSESTDANARPQLTVVFIPRKK